MTAPSHPGHLLVFEPDPNGHAAEWIEHLLRAVESRGDGPVISFVVPRSIAREIRRRIAGRCPRRVAFRPLGRREMALCNSRVLAASGFARWWVMRRQLRREGADRGLFLTMDHLTLPLGLGLGFGGHKVSGVLFRPSEHYSRGPERIYPLRERIRDLRKMLLCQLTLLNPSVAVVGTLDPYFPEFARSRYRRSDKLRFVPDPAYPLPERANIREASELPLRSDRTTFLIFGYLSRRKGVLTLIEALRRLEFRYTSVIAVVMAGRIDRRIARHVRVAANELAETKPELSLAIHDRYLTSEEIAARVKGADVVLAPYQRFVGSSGVLLWAANAGKPVITQDYGLVGRLVREYGLGLGVDTSDPSDLAGALALAVRRGADGIGNPKGMARFVDGRTPAAFASSLLNGALEADDRTAAP